MTNQDLNEQVARNLGWDFYHSKHGHWIITSPKGERHEPGFGCWSPFDDQTGEPTPPMKPLDHAYGIIPDYSGSIAAAWEIVEQKHLGVTLTKRTIYPQPSWECCIFQNGRMLMAEADTASEAIVKAFLKLGE